MIEWQWSSFEQLSKTDVYTLLSLREAVFVVEQACVYQDADGLDLQAWHLLGWQNTAAGRELAVYLRVIPPGHKYPEPAIGRVLTAAAYRRQGLARALMLQGIEYTRRHYPKSAICLSAQAYLQPFYEGLGFVATSDIYDEDGIPHRDMCLSYTP